MTYDVAVIAGDGIGKEVVPVGMRCVEAVAHLEGFDVSWTEFDWGSDHFHRHGRMMPTDGLDRLSEHEAIFLGAVGSPDIPDTETLWGLLIPIRRTFDQYVNLRPVRTLAGVPGPLDGHPTLDVVIVRENVEGEYSDVGGRSYRGTPHEAAMQQSIFTRHGISRVARFAVELASGRRGQLVSATKSNGIIHTMPFWDEVVAETVEAHGGVVLESVLIDALAARLVLDPGGFDVIVASNLFGDILSDLAGALAGSIGLAPSGNLDPSRRHPSMFEPVHGSAPDIAGKGVANPIGQIWAAAMLLDHLGEGDAARRLVSAFEAVLASGVRTRDLGGDAGTLEMADEIVKAIASAPPRDVLH